MTSGLEMVWVKIHFEVFGGVKFLQSCPHLILTQWPFKIRSDGVRGRFTELLVCFLHC